MKTAFGILARDLKALLRNPIATLVVGALLVLPGLYAWYCIIANWDPYSNTGNVPVAIVNKDKGASSDFAGEVNIGKQVADKLVDNDSIDWRFYDSEEEALRDTRDYTCYATVVFPEDLSENILGIFEGSNDPPTVYYYPNEKYNAVGTKVTDSAAQTLVKEINHGFSSTVNQTFLEKFQDVAHRLEDKAEGISNSALADIKSAQADIKAVIKSLDDAADAMRNWREAVAGGQSALAGAEEQLPAIDSALSQGSGDLNKLRAKTDEFSGVFAQSLVDTGEALTRLSGNASSSLGKASADVSAIAGAIDGIITQLESIVDNLFTSDATKDLRNRIDATLERLSEASTTVELMTDEASATLKSINRTVKNVSNKTKKAASTFTKSIMPGLSSGTGSLASALYELSGAVKQFEPQVKELEGVLSQTDSVLVRGGSAVSEAKTLLREISRNLESTVDDLNTIGSALQIDGIADILDLDPDNLGMFMSSPVRMETVEVFPVSNYGTAVAPFYTNLALWIGCFILASLIRVEIDCTGFERATNTQRYFGRWLLFVILSLLQSQVICGVDILLGIDCANPALFMLAGAVCSFVYMNLIYALVITFRNLGKTLCILLLIMQVPGSSGMYPIEMMPSFFQAVHPLLPFTYGIDAMRESLCGMQGAGYFYDLGILLLLVPVSLLLGVVLRPYLLNLTVLFDEEMRKTGFFATEENAQGRDTRRFLGFIRTLASSDEHRDEIEARAWRFSRYYPKLHRAGSIATIAIPFVFLVLFLPFNMAFDVDVNVKLNWFMAMLVVLLIVMAGMILLEYTNRTIIEETRALGKSLLDDDLMADLAELQAAAGVKVSGAAVDGKSKADDSADGESEGPSAGNAGDVGDDGGSDADDGENADSGIAAVVPPLVVNVPQPSSKGSRRAAADRKRNGGGPIRDIFLTDLRLGSQSAIGIVVIALLVVTPAMYAWLNIAGSWDPYGKTNGLKVAVANTDEGYKGDLIPVTVNVGDTLVSQLRGNESFDWTFVDKDEAISGVENGDYYAAIVIPAEFSRNLMTHLAEDADYPDVLYYTNKKENPIAPIITQKGADAIQESIRSAFTQRIDEVGLSIAHDLVEYVTQPRVGDYVLKMSRHLDDATHDMGSGSHQLTSLASLTATVSDVLDTTGVVLDNVKGAVGSTKNALETARSGVSSAAGSVSKATSMLENLFEGTGNGLSDLESKADQALAGLQQVAKNSPATLRVVAAEIDKWISVLEVLSESMSGEGAKKLDIAIDTLSRLSKAVTRAANNASGTAKKIGDARDELSNLVDDARDSIADARSYFNRNIKSSIRDLKSSLSTVASSTGTIAEGIENAVEGVSNSTDGLGSQLIALSKGLRKAGKGLGSSARSIEDAKERLMEALESGDIDQVKEVLLGSDVAVMAKNLADPVKLERQPMFTVRNYGSSMAPFYTVLSLWVGALVMISTMRVHVVEERLEELRKRYVKVRPRHEFFGRYCIFGFVSLLQSSLVLLGDLLFLHIQCVNPLAFLLFGIFIGQVFCLIVYTFTELFGDIGKALCVILLIMQVAASGGTFPVDMLNPVLHNIAPFLPFYHAGSLLQECVAGIDLASAAAHVGVLLVAVGVMLLIGVVVRRPFRILTDFFERQLEKTGYM